MLVADGPLVAQRRPIPSPLQRLALKFARNKGGVSRNVKYVKYILEHRLPAARGAYNETRWP